MVVARWATAISQPGDPAGDIQSARQPNNNNNINNDEHKFNPDPQKPRNSTPDPVPLIFISFPSKLGP